MAHTRLPSHLLSPSGCFLLKIRGYSCTYAHFTAARRSICLHQAYLGYTIKSYFAGLAFMHKSLKVIALSY